MSSLHLIQKVKQGDRTILHKHTWLQYLFLTAEKNINLEQVESIAGMKSNPVLSYVEKTLQILNSNTEINLQEKTIIEEVLMWCEVAKCGSKSRRREWKEKGYNLGIHNIGSAQIYAEEKMKFPNNHRNEEDEELIFLLIYTHGLIGQVIRGEVRFKQLEPLAEFLKFGNAGNSLDMHKLLLVLNQCIIEAVSPVIWRDIQEEVTSIIKRILESNLSEEYSLEVRLKKLRKTSIQNGEKFEELYAKLFQNKSLEIKFDKFFKKTDLWYVEAALHDFSLVEFIKINSLIIQKANLLTLKQISYEPFMKDIYYDYKGNKAINLYKKRIIEAYLKEMDLNDVLHGKQVSNEHVELQLIPMDSLGEVVGIKFQYSKAGEKLIEFCQEAEKSPLYERSIILLYDFFGFRKDSFDRLQNEKTYLSDMNNAEKHKKAIADYAVGHTMIDIGAGGGVMLDILSEQHPTAKVIGIDISTNVIEELEKRKVRENKNWNVKRADALELKNDFHLNSVDTIIFSSILHEMYSYIPFEGKKFNPDVIKHALRSAFNILKPGGRIIIRDGIMSEPTDQIRQVNFTQSKGIDFFKRYVNDFKGRNITYKQLNDNSFSMRINDAMEFLYTYTWGEEAYPHEVQEQFGYFTPTEYKQVIHEVMGENGSIIIFEHYLQEGYEEHLSPLVKIMDDKGNVVSLPDSTCFIVIEKYL
ncbi:class I SAM-dependent methyltransferase [Bacillus sp. B1-b2]|uniref:class I SAM-dependent methyltransferase n=1 Tax=Bacillus sp. B1-b2 TaxID=2653201 RepID=UPI001261EDD2|nr:class I SAM-dependent methyltransferase [Bacillus sp. B1-b2]KAB7673094.1 class I SAM-dependent methyltransferase [Bacillus sp. B1-b2]